MFGRFFLRKTKLKKQKLKKIMETNLSKTIFLKKEEEKKKKNYINLDDTFSSSFYCEEFSSNRPTGPIRS